MNMVTEEIAKQMVNIGSSGSGSSGGGVFAVAVNIINQALIIFEGIVRIFTSQVNSNKIIIVLYISNFIYLNFKIQQDVNDFINFIVQFISVLVKINFIGFRFSDFTIIVWEEINRLRDVFGKSIVDVFEVRTDQSLMNRVIKLESESSGGGGIIVVDDGSITFGIVFFRKYWYKELFFFIVYFSVSSMIVV